MNEEKLNIFRLSRTKGMSNLLFHKSLKIYGTATNIIKNIDKIKKNIFLPKDDELEKELKNCEKEGVKIIDYTDNIYPDYLKNIPSFPIVLSCKGNLELLKNERKLAIVGSRTCSINNFNFVKKISAEVSNYGYIIVSGMAKGIDAAGHIGSLKNGTIAVVGTGINKIYPKENEYLYYEILDNNGLIITEFPYNTTPKPENFPMRNRIIVGLVRGVLIANAGAVSGTTYTAKQALEFNREIMVFPGSPYDEKSVGSNKLLKEGATMVVDTKDIIECLETFMPLQFDNFYLSDNSESYQTNGNSDDYSKIVDKYDYNDNFQKDEDKKMTLEELILSKIDFIPISIDELIENIVGYDLNTINSTIIKMQLSGKIAMEGGKVFLFKK